MAINQRALGNKNAAYPFGKRQAAWNLPSIGSERWSDFPTFRKNNPESGMVHTK
jgi:hypothetical protein